MTTKSPVFRPIVASFVALSFAVTAAAEPVDFVRDVRPLFEKHRRECHGEKKQKSGLRLDGKAAGMKGGDNHGPDILTGLPPTPEQVASFVEQTGSPEQSDSSMNRSPVMRWGRMLLPVCHSRSRMSNETGRGWIELEFRREAEITSVVWGRDREGPFEDRLATDYRIEVAPTESRLLWRYPSRRLEAESIRDTILAVSGQLNLKMYGRGFDFFDQRGRMHRGSRTFPARRKTWSSFSAQEM